MELIEVIKYFGKFPTKEGVLKGFKRDDDKTPGYLDLKSYFTTMDPHSLVPEIDDFFVFANDKDLGDNIKSVSGWFMLLEPAGIQAQVLDDVRNRDALFTIQITIAKGINQRASDQFGEFVQQDKGLELMKRMQSIMQADDRNLCANKRWLDNAYQINPIEPYLLFQCKGWEMTINRNYSSML